MTTTTQETGQIESPSRAKSLLSAAMDFFGELNFYERFEQAVILVLTVLIVLIVASATWHLAEVVGGLLLADAVQPTNQAVFQTLFGMVFTVIIALEFKHSLLVSLARQESVVRVRSIVLIAMLAMVRKFIILDLGVGSENELFALSAAILSLGVVYWLVRDQDQRLANGPSLDTREPAAPVEGRAETAKPSRSSLQGGSFGLRDG